MNRRRFRSGRLSVVGRFDGETLLGIDLPRNVPPNFSADDLNDLLSELESFAISFIDAPPFHQRVWKRLRMVPWGAR
jgi:hypothetical protein